MVTLWLNQPTTLTGVKRTCIKTFIKEVTYMGISYQHQSNNNSPSYNVSSHNNAAQQSFQTPTQDIFAFVARVSPADVFFFGAA